MLGSLSSFITNPEDHRSLNKNGIAAIIDEDKLLSSNLEFEKHDLINKYVLDSEIRVALDELMENLLTSHYEYCHTYLEALKHLKDGSWLANYRNATLNSIEDEFEIWQTDFFGSEDIDEMMKEIEAVNENLENEELEFISWYGPFIDRAAFR